MLTKAAKMAKEQKQLFPHTNQEEAELDLLSHKLRNWKKPSTKHTTLIFTPERSWHKG